MKWWKIDRLPTAIWYIVVIKGTNNTRGSYENKHLVYYIVKVFFRKK